MPCVRMYICIRTHTHTPGAPGPSPFSSHFCHTSPHFPASLLSGATFCEHRTGSPRSCRCGESSARARWRVCTSLAPCSLLLLLPRSRQGCLCLLLLLSLSATGVVSVARRSLLLLLPRLRQGCLFFPSLPPSLPLLSSPSLAPSLPPSLPLLSLFSPSHSPSLSLPPYLPPSLARSLAPSLPPSLPPSPHPSLP